MSEVTAKSGKTTSLRGCLVVGCPNHHEARGYCNKHYLRFRHSGDPLKVKEPQLTCSVDGCANKHHSKGLCNKHRLRLQRHGDISYQTHHMRGTPEYRAWFSMKQRCYNPNNKAYALYGGQSVIVCEEWRTSFEAFYAYVGPRSSKRHSLDRIEFDKGYMPGNVRWATKLEQTLNRRIPKNNKTGYRGVWRTSRGNYRTTLKSQGKTHHLGAFSDVEVAALAYDVIAVQLWGSRAKTNILRLETA